MIALNNYLFAGCLGLSGVLSGCSNLNKSQASQSTHTERSWKELRKSTQNAEMQRLYWPLFAVSRRVQDKDVVSKVVVLTREALNGSEGAIEKLIEFASSKRPSDADIEMGARTDYIIYIMLNVGDAQFSSVLRTYSKRLPETLTSELIDEIKHMKLEQGFKQTMAALNF